MIYVRESLRFGTVKSEFATPKSSFFCPVVVTSKIELLENQSIPLTVKLWSQDKELNNDVSV